MTKLMCSACNKPFGEDDGVSAAKCTNQKIPPTEQKENDANSDNATFCNDCFAKGGEYEHVKLVVRVIKPLTIAEKRAALKARKKKLQEEAFLKKINSLPPEERATQIKDRKREIAKRRKSFKRNAERAYKAALKRAAKAEEAARLAQEKKASTATGDNLPISINRATSKKPRREDRRTVRRSSGERKRA